VPHRNHTTFLSNRSCRSIPFSLKHRHQQYGKSYVPLKWSNSLKASSQVWAQQLLNSCGQSLYHDPNNDRYGENLASNSGSGSYAAVQSTEDILGRFVEWEQDWEWPRCAHLTQGTREWAEMSCSSLQVRKSWKLRCEIL
jgi:hypothetical protein